MEEGTDSDGAGSPQPNSSDIEAGETDPEEGTDSDGAGTPQPNSLDKEAFCLFRQSLKSTILVYNIKNLGNIIC